jgi:hypothetical protein
MSSNEQHEVSSIVADHSANPSPEPEAASSYADVGNQSAISSGGGG